ncbi:MAG TPA: alpha/beta fold hydrolase [Azospira sp.]|nr:alpha/beta fold hydrolase [Azospira sp.]
MTAARKRPLALLHGWGLDSRAWDGVAPLLEPHFALTRLQLPGYPGRADLADSSVAATVDALLGELPQPTLLLGWSLGGQIAQLMAARAPQRITGLVLVGTSPRFVCDDGWPHGQPASLLATFSGAVSLLPGPVLPRFNALINQGDSRAKDLTRQLAPLTKAPLPDTAALLRGLDWLRDLDLRPLAARLSCPALVIHGEADALMPLAAARWLAAHLPQASLQVMPGAAHTPFLHDPEGFARGLAAWAEGLPA